MHESNCRGVSPLLNREWPPRHRRDARSIAWRCRCLTARRSQHGRIVAEKGLCGELSGAPDSLFDAHRLSEATPAGGPTVGGPPPVDGLNSPENVARFFAFLLLETSDDEFGEKDWDIRDEAHHGRWAR